MQELSRIAIAALALAGCGQRSTSDQACVINGTSIQWREGERAHVPPELRGCPRTVACPVGHSAETVASTTGDAIAFACVDARGRYDGRVVGFDRRAEATVMLRGTYRGDAPDGEWECTKVADGERLVFEFDADAFAEKLWGVALDDVGSIADGHHLGPHPHTLCPAGDWPSLVTNGFDVEPIGKLQTLGVVRASRHEPGRPAE